LLAHGRWSSPGTPASSNNATGHHDIAEILLKVALNTKNQIKSNAVCNRIGGEVVRVLASSAVDRGLEPRSGQTKNYKIGICCFSAKQAALRRNGKD
jgi:GGDEF domain-containing protein